MSGIYIGMSNGVSWIDCTERVLIRNSFLISNSVFFRDGDVSSPTKGDKCSGHFKKTVVLGRLLLEQYYKSTRT